MKNFFGVLVLLLILTACKKDSVKKNLKGTWTATSMTAIDFLGSEIDLIASGESMRMTFENCADESGCPVSVELSLDGDIEVFNTAYTLMEEETKMGIAFTFEEIITIEELTESSLKIYTPSFVYGDEFRATLTKD